MGLFILREPVFFGNSPKGAHLFSAQRCYYYYSHYYYYYFCSIFYCIGKGGRICKIKCGGGVQMWKKCVDEVRDFTVFNMMRGQGFVATRRRGGGALISALHPINNQQ